MSTEHMAVITVVTCDSGGQDMQQRHTLCMGQAMSARCLCTTPRGTTTHGDGTKERISFLLTFNIDPCQILP
jgi:hypothetical protein